jgi:hypothetical protein
MATNALPLAVEFEPHIHAVTRRPGDFADDHAFTLGQSVDKGALSHVAAADDGQFQFRIGGDLLPFLLLDVFGRRQRLENFRQQLVAVAFSQDAGAQKARVHQGVEFGNLVVHFW